MEPAVCGGTAKETVYGVSVGYSAVRRYGGTGLRDVYKRQDKDENFNRILSQNVKMSLDFRRLKLNGNILICGGSGAGKTFYEVKPDVYKRQRLQI